ncbi:MAG: hypothetical protein OXC44_02980 [Proteobacteria bacterium]|nr:hypothetical protein [Pseudomonadota bacterium]
MNMLTSDASTEDPVGEGVALEQNLATPATHNNNNKESSVSVDVAKEKELVVEAVVRKQLGKSVARKLRRRGMLPANILLKKGSLPIELHPKWLAKIWGDGGHFVLRLDGEDKRVRIHEIQLHPVKRVPVHVDLVYSPTA